MPLVKTWGVWLCRSPASSARIWWLHDELDQAAATLSMNDPSYVNYLAPTYRYWFFEFVDPKGKGVWHGLTGKPGKPMLLKAHLWKNSFHEFEHALVGYITCQAVRGEQVKLYYAFQNVPAEDTIHPYLFSRTFGKVDQTGQKVLGNLNKTVVEFSRVKS